MTRDRLIWIGVGAAIWTLIAAAPLGAEPIAYTSLLADGAYMLRLDLETGLGELFPVGGGAYGLTFSPSGQLYGAAYVSPDVTQLFTLDLTTAEYVPIGMMNVRWGGGLAFTADHRLWLVSGGRKLYEVGPTTAEATLVLEMSNTIVGLTGCGNRLLGLEIHFAPPGSGNLVVIDPDAGTVTPAGPALNALSTDEGGLAFDAGGRLWAVLDRAPGLDPPNPVDAVVELDPLDGTVLSSLTVNAVGSSLAIAPPPAVCPLGVPVTEIPTLGRWPLATLAVLLALGGLACARRLNRPVEI